MVNLCSKNPQSFKHRKHLIKCAHHLLVQVTTPLGFNIKKGGFTVIQCLVIKCEGCLSAVIKWECLDGSVKVFLENVLNWEDNNFLLV